MSTPAPNITVNVDVTNPGQFFACCGLLELANRLWAGAEGWFGDTRFHISALNSNLTMLAQLLSKSRLEPADPSFDKKAVPLRLTSTEDVYGSWSLLLNWWRDDEAAGGSLKTWAGQQSVSTIAQALWHAALRDPIDADWLNRAELASAPFYFDARRFAGALDTGFSLDKQNASTVAHPAVEILALIGIQRFRPYVLRDKKRTFRYRTWTHPLPVQVASAVVSGEVTGAMTYEFLLHSRDDQNRYKAFNFANPIGDQL